MRSIAIRRAVSFIALHCCCMNNSSACNISNRDIDGFTADAAGCLGCCWCFPIIYLLAVKETQLQFQSLANIRLLLLPPTFKQRLQTRKCFWAKLNLKISKRFLTSRLHLEGLYRTVENISSMNKCVMKSVNVSDMVSKVCRTLNL